MAALLNEILDPKLVVLELREQTAAEAILEIVERLRGQTRERLLRQGVDEQHITHSYVAEMRYVKQVFEVSVTLDPDRLRESGTDGLEHDFEAAYQAIYGQGSGFREAGIELVTLRVTAVGRSHIRPALPKREREVAGPLS
jgi:N-methylhydantoinase A